MVRSRQAVILPRAADDPSSGPRSSRPALDAIDAEERGAVLDLLLRSSPGLAPDAERIARDLLGGTSAETVAEALECDLRSLPADELDGRAGRQSFGYVEPSEAAWEILGEAIEPYSRDVKRLAGLGMTEAATEAALGTIAGLYRCRSCDDGELLLSWAPDFAAEHAGGVLDELVEAGAELPEERLAGLAPEWTDWLAGRRHGR